MSTIKGPRDDLTGKRFRRLVVTKLLGRGKYDKYWWECKCDCGGTTTLPTSSLTRKKSPVVSCGCYRDEVLSKCNRYIPFKHGLHGHKLYKIYQTMLQRCYNPNSQRWKYYGEKGIGVCDIWREDFINFYNWAVENGWQDGLSIDRLDSNKGYEPDNCQWVTVSENSRRMNVDRNRRAKVQKT